MQKQPHKERTLVLLKTDTVQRSLVGEVIRRFERAGLKITAMKMVIPTEAQLEAHYDKDDAWYKEKGERTVADMKAQGREPEKDAIEYGRDIIRSIIRYMTESPVVALVLEGANSIEGVTKLVGTTEPSTADVGTIRGDFTVDSYGYSTFEDRSVKNLIHCSDVSEEAEREIKVWFSDNEIHDYISAQERILNESIKDR